MAETKTDKPLNLTDLSVDLEYFNHELQRHTSTRNYLYRVINDEVVKPVISFMPEVGDAETEPYQIDLEKVPDDVLVPMFIAMIEHEEKLAFDAWTHIAEVGVNAIEVIKRVKEMRANPPVEEEEEIKPPPGQKEKPCPPKKKISAGINRDGE